VLKNLWVGAPSLLFACGGMEPRSEITFDPCATVALRPEGAIDEEERTSVHDAVAMWSAVGLDTIAVDGDATNEIALELQPAAGVFYGYYDGAQGRIYINRTLIDRRQRAIAIAHELGHAFGLDHVDREDRTSVMNPANVSEGPTSEDRAALGACP
jgi:hypothetical protein